MTIAEYEKQVVAHSDRLYTFAAYFIGDHEEARDVLQEVFARMWTNREGLAADRVGAWLSRVTRNACIDAYRRRRVSTRAVTTDTALVEQVVGGGEQPDAAADRRIFGERLSQALAELREPYRTIVIMREIQDMKYSDIAETLELPLGTVKVYLFRGRRMLREQLEKWLDREPII